VSPDHTLQPIACRSPLSSTHRSQAHTPLSSTVKMSSTLKQVIVNAIHKVSSDPAYAGREYATADAAREDFVKALIEMLFPENPSVPAVKERKKPGPKPKLDENGNPIRKPRSPKSAVSPDSLASSPTKEKKKPGPKPKLDENGQPIKKAKSPKKKEEPAAEKAEASPRKARAPMSEEAKAAMVAKRKATMEAKKAESPAGASPKKTPKKETPPLPASPPAAPKKAKKAAEPEAKTPKKAKKAAEPKPESPKKTPKKAAEPKPESPKKAKKEKKAAEPPATTANLDKFTPTQKKKLAEIVGDKADKKDVLSYLNGLSNAAFNDKKLEEHFRDYVASLAPPKAPEPAAEEQELVEVEFDGETYAVNPETKRVYTVDENGNATPVGYAGMDGKFANMEIPEDEDSESEGEE